METVRPVSMTNFMAGSLRSPIRSMRSSTRSILSTGRNSRRPPLRQTRIPGSKIGRAHV